MKTIFYIVFLFGNMFCYAQSDEISNPQIPETIDENETVPFVIVEKAPIYPNCEDVLTNSEIKACTSKKIDEFVSENFKFVIVKRVDEHLQLVKLQIAFNIDRNGLIADVRAKSKQQNLEDEAIRVIKLLPKMQPGINRGNSVRVAYSMTLFTNEN